MMKKSISILVLLAFVAVGAFAQLEMSVGGGIVGDISRGNGAKWDPWFDVSVSNTSFGGFLFFDATYAVVDVSFAYGRLTQKYKIPFFGTGETDASALQLGFGLLGKYPIEIAGTTFFPLLGINYNLVLSMTEDGKSVDDAGDFSQFGILAGLGYDQNLSDNLYVRLEALYQIRFPSKFANDMAQGNIETTFGMGTRGKIAIGYRL